MPITRDAVASNMVSTVKSRSSRYVMQLDRRSTSLAVLARKYARPSETVVVLVLLAASALVLHQPLVGQEFTVDESRWITTSRYFWTTFIDHDLFGPAWQPNYLILTHPPLGAYFLGFGLWLQGWRPEQLNGRFDSLRSYAFNAAAGNVPSPALLAAARWVEFSFALAAMLLLYLVGRTLDGPLAGVLAVVLALDNPLLPDLWTRALAEAQFAFFALLALLLGQLSVARLSIQCVQTRVALATGATLGLATATKLTGVLGCVGLAFFFGLQQALALWRSGRLLKLGHWLVLGLGVAVTFVAVNPMLYTNPPGNTILLFQFRYQEMQEQRRLWPSDAVQDNLAARSRRVAKNVFEEDGTLARRVSVPLEVLVFLGGLAVLLLRTARSLKVTGSLDPPALFLCWALATYAVSTINLGYSSEHYYAPMDQLNVVVEAIGLSWAAGWLLDRARYVLSPGHLT